MGTTKAIERGKPEATAASPRGPGEADLRLAAEFVRRLGQAAGGFPFEVTMFGSRARGDAEPESDLDLYVTVPVERVPAMFRELVLDIETELTIESGILVSAFVADLEYVRTHRGWSLLEAVEEEGTRI